MPQELIRRALSPGEQVLWTGNPVQGMRLRPSDWVMIPFSLMWCGFVVFWNVGVWNDHAPLFARAWGLPFLAFGIYFLVGRFVVDAISRSRTVYALTDQRVLIVRNLFSQKTTSLSLASLPQINLTERSNGYGDILFGYQSSTWDPRMNPGSQPSLMWEGIPGVRLVNEQLLSAQKRAQKS